MFLAPAMSTPRFPEAWHKLSDELLLSRGGEGILEVRGDSMRPTLRAGRSVRVAFRAGAPHLGDLVVFRQVDYLAVHRYLGPTRGPDGATRLRTRGDGVPKFDPAVEPERVLGRVVALERPDGWWSAQGRGARGYAIALAIHALCWTTLGAWAGRIDAALGTRVAAGLARLDAALLRAVDAIGFRALHARVAPPPPVIL